MNAEPRTGLPAELRPVQTGTVWGCFEGRAFPLIYHARIRLLQNVKEANFNYHQ